MNTRSLLATGLAGAFAVLAVVAAARAQNAAVDKTLATQSAADAKNAAPWVPVFTPSFADFVSRRVRNYMANTYSGATVLLDQLWVR